MPAGTPSGATGPSPRTRVDSEASRSIPDYTSVRLGASWQVASVLYQVRVENLFDEEIQTGLSSDGIRTLASPRALWVSAEWSF